MRRTRPALLAAATGVVGAVLAGCSSAGGSAPPDWRASQQAVEPGVRATPIIPVPSLPGSRSAAGPAGPSARTPAPSSTARVDPLVVATKLRSPVGLTLLPDGTALVGERSTGRIVRVQPRPGRPVPTVRTLPGLDTAGDGGLLDLALSPTYSEDGLVYAYVTTATDNRVVDFTLTGPVTPVLTGIPKGRTGNTGRIAFGADGELYVGTGDAGRPQLAARASSLAGKVLRVDPIGDPATDNPTRSSPVWTRGHQVVDGLCPVPRTTEVLEVEPGRSADEVNRLRAGLDFGWPAASAASQAPLATLPSGYRSPGGCALLNGRVWVTSLDGRALLSAPLVAGSTGLRIGRFTATLVKRYGRLRTVVAAADGALWLTTSNRDGTGGGPGSSATDDERVIRYLPPDGGGGAPPV